MRASTKQPDPAAPLVSIVTVSLNAAATIEDTLSSVSMQRAEFDMEHICVDGGSNDGTREIIDRWALGSSRVQRVYESDTGIFDAMNKGLHAARGDYVLFLNADDFLVSPDIVSTAMCGLSAGAPDNPDLVVGDVSMGQPGHRGVWRHRRVPRLLGRVRGTGLFPLHQGMFAKRHLLQRAGGFNASLRLAADVNQFYDLERLFKPSMRFVAGDIAFMRAGGAANAGFEAIWRGSLEIYRHLQPTHGALRAAGMLIVKTLQSVSEVRYGRTPHARWMGIDSCCA